MERGEDAKRRAAIGDSEALDLAERLARAACREFETGRDTPEDPPRVVAGYEILGELGRGGQGTVHLARDRELGREVALKILPWTTGVAEQRRLRREAEITAHLDLPQVCKIFEVGRFEGGTYVAMQHVVGETVSRRIGKADGSGPIDLQPGTHSTNLSIRARIDAVLTFVSKVARAVHRVHLEGVVHRDLKPGNLMLTPDGGPVILDFGLARADDRGLETLTATGDVFGTPAYMAPELLGDEPRPADRGSDVWALGCILWELLFARRPFDGPTRSALLEAIRVRPLPHARRMLPGLPPEVEAVLETALERDLSRRYPTAEALAEDLERIVERRPVLARRSSWALRARRVLQRHPLRVTTAGLAFLLFSVAPTVVAVQARRAADEIRGEQRRSEALANLALNAISDALVELGDSALSTLPWEVERRRSILAQAEQLLLDLESDPAVADRVPAQRIEIHFELARLGDGTQRDTDAERHMSTALELLERHPDADLEPERRLEIERTARIHLAMSLMRQGFLEDAERTLRRAGAHPLLRDDAFSLAGFLHARALIAAFSRDPVRALELADRAARELDRADAALEDIPPEYDIERAELQITRSAQLRKLKRLEEAADVLDPALAALDARPPARHAIDQRFTLTSCLNERALARMAVKRYEEARGDIDRSVAIHDDLLTLAPDSPDFLFQAGQSRVIRADLLRRMGATTACETDLHDALGLLRRDVPALAASAHVSISFLRSLMRIDYVAQRALPEDLPLQSQAVARAVEIGQAVLPRYPDNQRLLLELSPAIRRLAELHARQDDLDSARSILEQHCDLLENRFGIATDVVPASERFWCLHDLARFVTRAGDLPTGHQLWTRAYEFARRAAAEPAPDRAMLRAPFIADRERLDAAFELELWDEIERACDDPMRHLETYLATFSEADAAKRWTRHPLYAGSARFLEPLPLGDWPLRLRLMAAVRRLHGALLGEDRPEGDVWDRARDRLRRRWTGLHDAALRDLGTRILEALGLRRSR